MNRTLLFSLAIAFTMPPLLAPAVTFETGDTRVPLVELYTSEGCSSCPPADGWMTSMVENAGLWTRFVPVAFHVDYWNNLGWKDRFSAPEYSDRERKYAIGWGAQTVYTPCVVLNGQEWEGWASRPFPAPTARPGKLRVTVERGKGQVSFQTAAEFRKPVRVEWALLGMNLRSKVGGGENGGRELRHDFTVLRHGSAELLKGSGAGFTGEVSLAAHDWDAAGAAAFWVSAGDELNPLQATGGWIKHGE